MVVQNHWLIFEPCTTYRILANSVVSFPYSVLNITLSASVY